MNTINHSIHFIRQRRLYTLLPLLALPFVTFIYWMLVVKNFKESGSNAPGSKGLITSLPDAFLKDESEMNKLSYYKKAALDSAKKNDLIKKDPYRSGGALPDGVEDPTNAIQGLGAPFGKQKAATPVTYQGKTYSSPHEVKVFSKLKELDDVLTKSAEPDFKPNSDKAINERGTDHSQIKHLESLMAGLQSESEPVSEADPEMQELNGMLEKILDIQHPDRVTEKIREKSEKNRRQVFSVTTTGDPDLVSYLGADSKKELKERGAVNQTNGFYSLSELVPASHPNAIQAVIDETQTIVNGATIKLRLSTDVFVAGILVPKDSFIFGTASFSDERLLVEIGSIRKDDALFPVKLSLYDLDGMLGIYIPGIIARDVAKQSLSQEIQSLNIGTMDPSLGAQAASAGIQAAKTLLGKKTKLIQVTVKAGYRVLLRDGNSKDS